jgi:hypothetical protein
MAHLASFARRDLRPFIFGNNWCMISLITDRCILNSNFVSTKLYLYLVFRVQISNW